MRQERAWWHRAKNLKWVGIVLITGGLIFFVTPRRESVEPVAKIAFIDMKRLFNEYYRTKTVKAEFEATYNKEQAELEKKALTAKELQKKLQETGPSLTEEQKRRLEEQYKEELVKVKEYRDSIVGRLKREEDKAESQLLEELQKAVDTYATKQGYSMILLKSGLLYGAQSLDVTDDVLKTINSQ
jgi:Skp family chaperone for outer membrane proteins